MLILIGVSRREVSRGFHGLHVSLAEFLENYRF